MASQTKEVLNYREALFKGIELIQEKQILSSNMIINIQEVIERIELVFVEYRELI